MTSATFELTKDISYAKAARPAPAQLRDEPGFGCAVIEALDAAIAATPKELARITGISELVVRSVLEALTFVGGVDYDRATGRYSTRFSVGS